MSALVNTSTAEILSLAVRQGRVKLPDGTFKIGVGEGWSEGDFAIVPVVRDDTVPVNHKRTGSSTIFDGTNVVITAITVPMTNDEIATADADLARVEIMTDLTQVIEAILAALPPGQLPGGELGDAIAAFTQRRNREKARPPQAIASVAAKAQRA